MLRIRTLLISGLATASLTAGLVIPVTAADTKGTLAIVNGVPGQKVDVCLNGKELKSKLKYGGAVLKNVVPTGFKKLRFYKPDRRTCRGTLVAKKGFPLGAADDLTIVVTKKAPKVVTFDNSALGEIPPLGAPYGGGFVAWRHAAEFAVNFRYRLWEPGPETPIGTAIDPISTKGQQLLSGSYEDDIWQLRATLPESPGTIALKKVHSKSNHRYEWVFVGTNPRNAKFVVLDRKVSQPTP